MPDPTTTDQARDRLAELCGWKQRPRHTSAIQLVAADPLYPTAVQVFVDDTVYGPNPIPASLDWVARVWPTGWSWYRGWSPNCWTAQLNGRHVISGLHVSDANDVLLGLFTLLLRVVEWLRDNDKPAFEAFVAKVRGTL